MGETVLDRGLLPLVDGQGGPSADIQLEWMWMMVGYSAHRFRGRPIAEVLASWTNIMLMHRGVHPTVGDIARASGLPRATVSRYVDHTIQQGWAEERVNQQDRRRRELYLTETGAQQLEIIVEFFHEMFGTLVASRPADGASESGAETLERLAGLSAHISVRVKTLDTDVT